MIGSVHYIRDENSGVYYSVDNTPQMLRECIDNMFGGDAMEMVRRYYDLVVKNVKTFQPDIVGHFDLVTKFNENGEFFDEESDEYKAIATHALEQCADNGCVFEVNTGAMSRNWRSRPYPQPFLLRHMCSMGVPVMLSADSHSASTLTYAFDQALDLIKSSLYSQILQWRNGKFEKVDI
jgi:histidinol-phosphatase (PHP family)